MSDNGKNKAEPKAQNDSTLATPVMVEGGSTSRISVALEPAATEPTNDQALWVAIRLSTNAIRFERYEKYISDVLCKEPTEETDAPARGKSRERHEPARLLHGVDSFQLLKKATEAFLLANCGFRYLKKSNGKLGGFDEKVEKDYIEEEEATRLGREVPFEDIVVRLEKYLEPGTLPYLHLIARGLEALDSLNPVNPFCRGDVDDINAPCLLELIWSYWLEEGMLVQAINAVSLRFQNKRGGLGREPLANLEISPLRPLSNLLWGYIQDEFQRLTISRRAYEYEHHYGLSLVGKAVPHLRPANRRSKFLHAFHSLLSQVSHFYEKDADTTVNADGFSVLNALREVHMLLAEGAHNQFRDLPWTARAEMLAQQWLLARPEMLTFLGGPASMPYAERWMGPVDSLKRLLGWVDTPVTHFYDLAVNGEKILLSVRYGNWSVENNQAMAKNWARYWKPEIQRYIHAYQSVTGVNLSAAAGRQMADRINDTLPSVLLQQRLTRQRSR